MDLKIYSLERNARVTQQLTKSRDFCQNYLCYFHLCTLYSVQAFSYRMLNNASPVKSELDGKDSEKLGRKYEKTQEKLSSPIKIESERSQELQYITPVRSQVSF
jgi:hypothetical protein